MDAASPLILALLALTELALFAHVRHFNRRRQRFERTVSRGLRLALGSELSAGAMAIETGEEGISDFLVREIGWTYGSPVSLTPVARLRSFVQAPAAQFPSETLRCDTF
jgi:hypothetical protein